jgi:hypothetical protein
MDAPTLGHVGNAESSDTRFAFRYVRFAEESYARSCRNYERFGGDYRPYNETQPGVAAS